jgi:hypothetical protein
MTTLKHPTVLLKTLQKLHDDLPAAYQEALDGIVDEVLRFRPTAKSKPALRRKRRANKIAKEKS